jgi:universal stress protein A
MKITRILVPTDLSERSRGGLRYACSLAADNKGTLSILHVANALEAWEFYSDEFTFLTSRGRAWPTDRVLSEATLELNRFLMPHLEEFKRIPSVTKRVVLGPVPHQIASVAEEEKSDLIVMSPRRHRKFMRLFTASITERVTRMSPCPVLSVTPPLPSRPWRGKLVPPFFGWPRQRTVNI